MFRSATMKNKKAQLSKAVRSNNVDLVAHLLKVGTEVEASNLTAAISKGSVEIVRLLAAKLPQNVLSEALVELAIDKDYESPYDWRKSARSSDFESIHSDTILEMAKVLVEAGADVRASKDDGDVLEHAKASGHLQPLVVYIESVLLPGDEEERTSGATKRRRSKSPH